MAVHTLVPATCQVTGLVTTQIGGFTAVQMSGAVQTIADMASINQSIVDDQQIVSNSLGPSAATIQAAIIFTGTTVKNTATITSFVLTSPTGALIGSIQPGMRILGKGLAAGTRCLSVSGTTVTLDRNAISSNTTQTYCSAGMNFQGGFSNGQLVVPGRGSLKVFPSDVVFFDNLGWPYLVSSASINFNGGGKKSGAPWIFT